MSHVVARLRAAKAAARAEDAEDLAELRARADAWAKDRRRFATCRGEGCNGCCHGPIRVYLPEARDIAATLTPAQWARVLAPDPPGDPQLARCPLLDPDGRCGVYDRRPLQCRLYLAASPPEDCYIENGVKQIRILVDAFTHAVLGDAITEGRTLRESLRQLAPRRKSRRVPV